MFGLRRKGKLYVGDVCRADHPRHGAGYYACGKNGPKFRVPLKWVDDAPDDPDNGSGHYERV